MPSDWNPSQYLTFADERIRPCRDLALQVAVASVRRVIDLGCGPGNSTRVLADLWPDAEIIGLDSSPEMIARARADAPTSRWIVGDIAAWAASEGDEFDVVFSNAALHWLPDYASLFPRILRHVAPGGAFAMQMPANVDALPHELMRGLAASPRWRVHFPEGTVREWYCHDPAFYFDTLAPHAARLDIWQTEYLHILANAEAVVDWYKSTGLRPFLDPLPSDDLRRGFLSDYLDLVRAAFAPRADGRVLFPFQRLFMLAYR